MPHSVPPPLAPMLLSAAADVPGESAAWAYEVKWDGFRAVMTVHRGRAHAVSRHARPLSRFFPDLAGAVDLPPCVLDGEVVVMGDDGVPDFAALSARLRARPDELARLAADAPATFVPFDLLWLDGAPLLGLPLHERRGLLDALVLPPRWTVSQLFVGCGRELHAATLDAGLEGVVAKRLDSVYRPGSRTRSWIKVKHYRHDVLPVVGWLPGATGARALALGIDDGGVLRYCGTVEYGFAAADRRVLAARLGCLPPALAPCRLPADLVPVPPHVHVRVRYQSWLGGHLRHASFAGIADAAAPVAAAPPPAL